ncbi:exosome complex exonuclease RRP4 [Capsaspora owczarzaki ATCC 30864]|uniref:Exosome complex exonuclease RRP4 n=1 Tax=Capsaspora owczarzaki (strain ATCC 30864) TaxID=595528 RepID=A0A0D2VJT8_CAPO3|nr:exosome complex exonuclease RRP4 [Capsaspora owczarzaki ATCC 30864]KJE90267.1 exosome complex exonuclease RRP4 [Capsaspora owczarzaki ATCC 30864]|eukprot:XP_004364470.2 exosome complex exonuclease RRP4 [Capsaspora owczarzaki ATCC 30864]
MMDVEPSSSSSSSAMQSSSDYSSAAIAGAAELFIAANGRHIVCPGDTITTETSFMRGHGTYFQQQSKDENEQPAQLTAAYAGIVERVNKLLVVRPLRTRYSGEVGDVVVGRVTGLGGKRWKLDINARLDGILLLSSVNLPGGVLRRRSAEDELMMRDHLTEGDVISAEVQSLFSDGTLSLHTRSLKYGKLHYGSFMSVPSALIKRCKNHFHDLPCGVTMILGLNGYIWLSETRATAQMQLNPNDEIEETSFQITSINARSNIARIRNCINALASRHMPIYDSTVVYAYDASLEFDVKALLQPEAIDKITAHARALADPGAM